MITDQEGKLNKYFVHREFLNLFRAGRVGQEKEMSAKKFASPSEGAAEGDPLLEKVKRFLNFVR